METGLSSTVKQLNGRCLSWLFSLISDARERTARLKHSKWKHLPWLINPELGRRKEQQIRDQAEIYWCPCGNPIYQTYYNIEFLLGEDVLSATLVKAEVHFHFSNPQHLTIQPLLPSLEKRGFPTRYSVWLRDGIVELRVDLLVLFQALQLVIGGAIKGPSLMEMHRVRDLTRPGVVVQKQRPPSPQDTMSVVWGEENEGREGAAPLQPTLELGLALRCSLLDNIALPCQDYCVHLEHAPFIALTYT
ncbi:uncharacterized protein LOC128018119 [Carassius gibelio]|uniref:uncharacterized protein LOC128018119 n=1 Tax=Carassius gibelio TaxID=101364 RepID=UPI0022787D83|nr:uncharacterized protein LOC128018119 [Carassius gibelio]